MIGTVPFTRSTSTEVDMDASNCDVASTNWTHWHGIPWQHAHQVVGRLQAESRSSKGRRVAQRQAPAETPHPLHQCESAGGQTGHREPGSQDPGIDRQTWSTRTISGRRSAPTQGLAEADETSTSRKQMVTDAPWASRPCATGPCKALPVGARSDNRDDRRHSLLVSAVGARRQMQSNKCAILGRKHSPKWVLEGDIKGVSTTSVTVAARPMDKGVLRSG